MWKITTLYKAGEEMDYRGLVHFAEHLDLYAQGIAEMSAHKDHHPLHRAVFDNNLQLVQRIVVGERLLMSSQIA